MTSPQHPMEFRHKCHFLYHGRADPKLAHQEEKCHYCQFGKFNSHKLHPISIIFQDNTKLVIPKDFVFIEKSIPVEGVRFAEDEYLNGCECESDAQCMGSMCDPCLGDVDRVPKGGKPGAYHVSGDKKGCLRGWMLESRLPIYECHEKCTCSDKCPNRVVGRGRKVALQIFPTSGRGWGVKSTEDIKRGQFVGEYVGEIITPAEANRRRQAATDRKKKDIYLFALDKFQDRESYDQRLRGEPYEIDGEFKSGPTRFINHSCEPNLRIFAVVTAHANKPFHQLCFFAAKDIPRETELTFDYTDGVTDARMDVEEAIAQDKELTKCLCGTPSCRGYLW
ncbi:SET domain-containing protein [Drepanopeziza brunnea f. sp. 'multigermtubi' MB_m1]|uniref:SET domain-containing protein n=1 Tax=Marssonina brunnea f. sp. multigermtubi (strain MB_m1) TaxID=1072389 RepID=K1WEA6_MARBU|nr:SET domain-containing protein [Drepanopeziza brunnea f. sp. 'multigermtubi' MB_m1]EKD15740.1 SET domain-containing protein [Drepanopeziza brunnea f. sp. 'multigermtubi' MB_m1]